MLGKFDRKILLQRVTTSKGDTGQNIEDFATYRELWARLSYEGGGQNFQSQKETATNIVKFWIRYDQGITEQMRIYYNECYYDILHIEELGKKKFLILKAEKKR
jgi:SPP1 family predicted phage head-tail adaptor